MHMKRSRFYFIAMLALSFASMLMMPLSAELPETSPTEVASTYETSDLPVESTAEETLATTLVEEASAEVATEASEVEVETTAPEETVPTTVYTEEIEEIEETVFVTEPSAETELVEETIASESAEVTTETVEEPMESAEETIVESTESVSEPSDSITEPVEELTEVTVESFETTEPTETIEVTEPTETIESTAVATTPSKTKALAVTDTKSTQKVTEATETKTDAELTADEETEDLVADRSITPNSTLAYVKNLKVSGIKNGTVVMSWDPVVGADGYAVFRQGQNSTGMTYVVLATTNAYLDQGAAAGFNFYRVIPYFKDANGHHFGQSVEYKYTAVTPKPVDVNQARNYDDKSVKLTWKASPGANEYIIYRHDAVNSTGYGKYLYIVNGLTYSDINPIGGLNIYRIIPRLRTSTLNLTGIVNDYTYAAVSPKKLTRLTVTGKPSGDVNLNWNPSVGATDYLIFRKGEKDSGFTYAGTTKQKGYIDKNAKAGYNDYLVVPTYKNKSINQHRPIAEQTRAKAVTYPRAVSNLNVKLSGLWNNTLTWTSDTNADKYVIFAQSPDDTAMKYKYVVTSKSYNNNLLYPGNHYYRVYAVKNIGGKDYYSESKSYTYSIVPQPRNSATNPLVFTNETQMKHFIAIQTRNYNTDAYFRYNGSYEAKDILTTMLNNISHARSYFYDKFAYLPEGGEAYGTYWTWDAEWIGNNNYAYNIVFDLGYHGTKDQWAKAQTLAKQVADTARTYSTVFGQLSYGYEWLIKNVSYAYDSAGAPADFNTSGISTHTAYSVVLGRSSVCQGYTNFLNLVYRSLGFETYGAVSEADNHMWSMVKVNGKWYHIDATHGDMGTTADYSYFMRSAANMGAKPMHTMYTNFPDAPTDYEP